MKYNQNWDPNDQSQKTQLQVSEHSNLIFNVNSSLVLRSAQTTKQLIRSCVTFLLSINYETTQDL
ncbi:hypothetical protein C1H46_008362 [Malus baccata]|uniref:Uncharacterized protein n=1 Tax=Malus baccata TaxID=106549 RepID=A0A540N4S3_MALBA|nr:hypothetical protein C1H46_008362 [Malus baccata]